MSQAKDKKSVFSKLRRSRTRAEKVRKKFDKKNTSELIEAISPKIDNVAASLVQRNVISERKADNLLYLHSRSMKAQFLVEVLNTKGQAAMNALYEVARSFELWHAADILEPSNAPHAPRPVVVPTSPKSIYEVDGCEVSTARKVSFSDEGDGTQHRQETGATNATSLMSEGGDVDEQRESPDRTIVNESEDSDIESERENSQEGQEKACGGDDSNDASSEESDHDGGDKSNTDCKTREGGETGNRENAQSERTLGKETSVDEKQNEENMEKENEFTALLKSSPFCYIEEPNAEWTDVGGLTKLKGLICCANEQAQIRLKFPNLKKDPQSPLKNYLLFGPDTDMKYVARAIAKQAGYSCIISVSSADLVSIGEKESIMKAALKYARSRQKCIVIISEIDVLSTSKSQSAEQSRKDFLQQMTCSRTYDDIVVFGTTNQPWDVDSDIKGRFEEEVYIRLPDSSLRVEIFRQWFLSTPGTVSNMTNIDLEELARCTEGYSRTQINAIFKETLMIPLGKIQTATHFTKVRGPSRENQSVLVDDLWTPCGPNAPGAVEMSWINIPGNKMLEPLISKEDVLHVVQSFTFKDADEQSHERFERYEHD